MMPSKTQVLKKKSLCPAIFFCVLKIEFIFGCAGSSLLHGLFSSCRAQAFHCGGFSYCRAGLQGVWAQQLVLRGPRAQAQQLWHTGLDALRQVVSSQIRIEPCLLLWKVGSLSLSLQGSLPRHFLCFHFAILILWLLCSSLPHYGLRQLPCAHILNPYSRQEENKEKDYQ